MNYFKLLIQIEPNAWVRFSKGHAVFLKKEEVFQVLSLYAIKVFSGQI